MKYKLKDICLTVTDGSHFSPKGVFEGYPMFSVKDMLEYGFDYSNCKRISREDYKKMESSGCVPQKGDILVAKDGSYLKEIFVCEKTKEEAILSSIAIFRPNQDVVTPYYLNYLLKSPKVYNYISSNCVSGSALPRIVLKTFREVELDVPSLDIQDKVVTILKSIDDKIRLNSKINDNLTQQARSLYQAWFVDYEPFGGSAPSDWTNVSLGQVAIMKTDSWSPVKNPDDVVEHYSIPAYDEQHYPVFESATDIKSNKYILTPDSVMISKLNPDTKRIWRPMCLSANPVCSTEFIVYEARKNDQKDFIYSILDSVPFFNYLCAHTTGSTNSRQRATPKATLDFSFQLPPDNVIKDFCQLVTPMYDLITSNIVENQSLAKTRDSLLPRLMSGELDVSNLDI